MRIASIETVVCDIPTVRAHALAFGTIRAQSYVIVRIRDRDGREGLGEAATIGGPAWSEESVESIAATIDTYLAPALLDADPRGLVAASLRMQRAARGNPFAKAAVETALLDLAARAAGLPAHDLLGGQVRGTLELAWTLASGDAGRDVEEAREMLAQRRHRIFKVKIGAKEPAVDAARLARLRAGLPDSASLRVDVNQAWDEATARRWFPALEAAGVELVEQPLPRGELAGAARLRARTTMALMADEAAGTPAEVLALAAAGAADVVSLKLGKSGGAFGVLRVAAVAEAAGLPLYGGCMLETGLGTAAAAHVFAALPSLAWGCELFGPLLLEGSITTTEPRVEGFALRVPEGPGFGVTLDEDRLAFHRRGAPRGLRVAALAAG